MFKRHGIHAQPHTATSMTGQSNLRKRTKGQAAVIIALSIFVLVLFVGLAVDGGSMYTQRRRAQNVADAAAMAAARAMLDKYDIMIINNDNDVPGSADDEAYINSALTTYATAHGLTRNDLQAYYVNDNKQVVGNTQVGSYGGVPWDQGAKGVTVRASAQTDAFLMRLVGWNKVGAAAISNGYMGVAVNSNVPVGILPIGLFTDTLNLPNFVVGDTYTLINDDTELGSGNRGWLDFNGNGSGSVDRGWLQCGFNPTVLDDTAWAQWCPSYTNGGNKNGPTQHFQCGDLPDCTTPGAQINVPYIRYGVADSGWWIQGETGTTTSNCEDFRSYVQEGKDYMVPIFDYSNGTGSNTKYHMIALGLFHFESLDIDCHVSNNNGTGTHQHWVVSGTYRRMVNPNGGGHHGDLRHNGMATVFLDS